MLVLSRKVDQEILIGEDVKLTIIRVDGNRVRIGVEAPRDVRILRGELSADDASDSLTEMELELSPREMAFAHSPQRKPVGRLSRRRQRESGGSAVFEGTVSRDGGQIKLSRTTGDRPKRAPLASFVAAT